MGVASIVSRETTATTHLGESREAADSRGAARTAAAAASSGLRSQPHNARESVNSQTVPDFMKNSL
jgi:hypothetical protein